MSLLIPVMYALKERQGPIPEDTHTLASRFRRIELEMTQKPTPWELVLIGVIDAIQTAKR